MKIALLLMSTLLTLWETFVTMVCDSSMTDLTYAVTIIARSWGTSSLNAESWKLKMTKLKDLGNPTIKVNGWRRWTIWLQPLLAKLVCQLNLLMDDSIADSNILTLETAIEVEVLLTNEGATNWLLDFRTSYQITPFDHSFDCSLLRIAS